MIGAWLTGRWAVGLLACAALAAAAWFAGDAVALGDWRPLEGPVERGVFVAAVVIAWLGWEIYRRRRALRDNVRLLDGLAGGVADQDSAARAAHEIEVLRQRFEEALGVLRKARFRGADGERRTVSELPWYMFIGGPGSGKTTALLNASLRFPLGDPRAGDTLQGVGGTRNCDWWFTDEAVLLDTAGRYTTQSSDKQADAAAWMGFLDLLKRSRPRQPLNGAIVTLNAADLVHWNDEELSTYAAHVRDRVAELYARLGVRLPIYLMVTKTDLLAGFSEYFSEFDSSARGQVWGMTFAVDEFAADPHAVVARFDDEFRLLEHRLYAMLPARLQEERDLQRRAAVYRFPQQFRGTAPLIAHFLEAAFSTGWSGELPLLRGVYFTSGTQEGSPIDRVLGTLARNFNLERKVQPPTLGSGKSFFLRRLLKDVVFGESGLAGADQAGERGRRVGRGVALAAMAAASVLLVAGWTVSFFGNLQRIEGVAARTAEAKRELDALAGAQPGDEARVVTVLNKLRDLRQGSGTWSTGLGLSQDAKLDAQAERAYQNALREMLLPRLAAAAAWRLPGKLQQDLEAHLRAAQAMRGSRA